MDHHIQIFLLKHWYQIISQHLNPIKFCLFLGFCPAKLSAELFSTPPSWSKGSSDSPSKNIWSQGSHFLMFNVSMKAFSQMVCNQVAGDISTGNTSTLVFYGMTSACIDNYGHKSGGDDFFHYWRNFAVLKGYLVPSNVIMLNRERVVKFWTSIASSWSRMNYPRLKTNNRIQL